MSKSALPALELPPPAMQDTLPGGWTKATWEDSKGLQSEVFRVDGIDYALSFEFALPASHIVLNHPHTPSLELRFDVIMFAEYSPPDAGEAVKANRPIQRVTEFVGTCYESSLDTLLVHTWSSQDDRLKKTGYYAQNRSIALKELSKGETSLPAGFQRLLQDDSAKSEIEGLFVAKYEQEGTESGTQSK